MYQDILFPKGMVAKRALLYSLFLFVLSGCGESITDSDSISTKVLANDGPKVSLAVNAAKIKMNDDISLSWDSSNVSTCVASGAWSGNKEISGTQLVKVLSGKTKFTITCSGAEGSSSDTVEVTVSEQVPDTPAINLSASPVSIAYNGSTTLIWDSSNTVSCEASGGWSGNKTTSGSMVIDALTANTSFILSCSGSVGTVTDEISISVAPPGVTPPVSAPTVNLSASPASISHNGSTTLIWDSTNASSCAASGGWSGNKNTSGSMIINALTSNTSFSLSCSGAGGTVTDQINIIVAPPVSAPAVNLSASPLTVVYNGTTQLSWATNNSDNCVASGDWSGSKSLSGSEIRSNLTVDKTYTLTCTGTGGTTVDSVTISVEEPAPVLSFSASANTVEQNGSTTLNWSSSGVASCTASGDWSGSKNAFGTEVVCGLTADSRYA